LPNHPPHRSNRSQDRFKGGHVAIFLAMIIITSIVASTEIYGYQLAVAEKEKNKGTKSVSAHMDDPQLRQCPSGTTQVPGRVEETFLTIDATKSKGKVSGTFQVILNLLPEVPDEHFTKDGKITRLNIHGSHFSLTGIETKDEICHGSKVPVAVSITGPCSSDGDITFKTKTGEIVTSSGEDGVIKCENNANSKIGKEVKDSSSNNQPTTNIPNIPQVEDSNKLQTPKSPSSSTNPSQNTTG
jgi:hypothetical protein